MKKLLLFLIASAGAFAAAAAPPRPNILVILVDDVGWGDYQCYNEHGLIPSPNIDRLAREGMRFTHAHASAALCSPSRYSMLTGNYPWRGRNAAGAWEFNVPSEILPGQQTVAKMLHAAGYRTAMFGKAGIGGTHVMTAAGLPDFSKPMTDGPVQWGFDYSFIIERGHQWLPHIYLENGVATCDPARIVHGNGEDAVGTPGYGIIDSDFSDPDWDTRKVGGALLDHAEKFLDDWLARNRATGKSAPFFIHFCTDGAHAPYEPAEKIRGTRLFGETAMTVHTDMVMETDLLVGKLREMLGKRGLLDDTLIAVTSDNGGIPAEQKFGHDAVGGLRGMKFCIGEGGSREPFIVWWPGKIPAGAVRGQEVCIADIVPTALDLAGVKVPADQCLDTVSLVPVLFGRRDDSRPIRGSLLTQSSPGCDAFFDAHIRGGPIDMQMAVKIRQRRSGDLFVTGEEGMPHASPPAPKAPVKRAAKPQRLPSDGMAHAVYDRDWKLVINIHDEPAALYELDVDPAEQTNLIATYPDRVRRMAQEYRRIRASRRSTPAPEEASAF